MGARWGRSEGLGPGEGQVNADTDVGISGSTANGQQNSNLYYLAAFGIAKRCSTNENLNLTNTKKILDTEIDSRKMRASLFVFVCLFLYLFFR